MEMYFINIESYLEQRAFLLSKLLFIDTFVLFCIFDMACHFFSDLPAVIELNKLLSKKLQHKTPQTILLAYFELKKIFPHNSKILRLCENQGSTSQNPQKMMILISSSRHFFFVGRCYLSQNRWRNSKNWASYKNSKTIIKVFVRCSQLFLAIFGNIGLLIEIASGFVKGILNY